MNVGFARVATRDLRQQIVEKPHFGPPFRTRLPRWLDWMLSFRERPTLICGSPMYGDGRSGGEIAAHEPDQGLIAERASLLRAQGLTLRADHVGLGHARRHHAL